MAVSKNLSFFNIPPLSKTNYNWWKGSIECALESQSALHVLTKDAPADDPQKEKFKEKDGFAKSLVLGSVIASDNQKLLTCKSAKEMITHLDEKYSGKMRANSLFLLQRLFNAKMSDGDSLIAHLNKIMATVNDLKAIGSPPTNDSVIAVILGSLTKEYAHEVAFLKGVEKLTIDYAISYLESKSDAKPLWLLDSGSHAHIANNVEWFVDLNRDKKPKLQHVDGQELTVEGTGTVKLNVLNTCGRIEEMTLRDCVFVPEATVCLISTMRIIATGFKINLDQGQGKIWHKDGIELVIEEHGNYHYVRNIAAANNDEMDTNEPEFYTKSSECEHKDCLYAWHVKFAHRNVQSLQKLLKDCSINAVECDAMKNGCETCFKAKGTAPSYKGKSPEQNTKFLETVYSDLVGPIKESAGRSKYFVSFMEAKSRYVYTYLLKSKDQVLEKFKCYVAAVKNKFGKAPEVLFTDNGTEYRGGEFQRFLQQEGIEHKTTIPYSPQQNGNAERLNRTIQEMARSMLIQSGLSENMWAEAVNTAVYLHNRVPSKTTNKSPFELWHNRVPGLKHIRAFGSQVYAHVPKERRGKLDPRAEPGILVGYALGGRGYRIIDPKTCTIRECNMVHINESNILQPFKPATSTVQPATQETTDVSFFNVFDWQPAETTCEQAGPSPQESSSLEGEPGEATPREGEPTTVRQSARSNKGVPPPRYETYASVQPVKEPYTWKEVNQLPASERSKWIEAMEEEFESLQDKQVWTLTELPSERKAIGCKWVYKVKYDPDGKVDKYKARLVAKGFSQKFGIDFSDTFAPVVSYTSFRTLLSIAASRGMHVEHLDVKTAFLNGDLTEEIYMEQPEGFSTEGQEGLVCKLNKSIYGLKQAAKAWNDKLTKLLQKQNFQQGTAEPCLFSRLKNGQYQYILIYVDNLVICCQDQGDVQEIADELNKEVEVKQLGPIKYYLGIQIERTEDGSFLLSQKQKIMDFIESVGMKHSKPVSTPLEKDYLKNTDGPLLKDNHEYRSAIGKLLYLSTICRPDITSAVGLLCRKTSSPTIHDWKAIKRLARYLIGTLDYKLKISACDDPRLTGFMNANWGKDTPDGKSTSGYLFYYGDSLIEWTSQKQSVIAISTAEAECVSAQSASYELYWIIHLLKDFGTDEPKPIILFEDNQACIAFCKGEGTKSKNKTIALKCNYVKDLQDQGLIELHYCPTEEMIADIFTKPLEKKKFETLRERLNLHDFSVVT